MKIQTLVTLSLFAVVGTASAANLNLDTERVWKNLEEVRAGGAGTDASATFSIPLSKISKSAVGKYIEHRKAGDESRENDRRNGRQARENHIEQCTLVRAYSSAILKKIIAANKLEAIVATTPLELRFGVSCSAHPKWDLPEAVQSGGSINVDIGMVKTMQSESALAAVIAHELAHFLRRHEIQAEASQERWFRRLDPGGMFGGGRASIPIEQRQQYEKEADALGALLMERAGYKTEAAIMGLHLSDERSTLKEQVEFPQKVDETRRALLADRMQTLALGASITNHTPEAPLAAYPAQVKTAIDFYFDLGNLPK